MTHVARVNLIAAVGFGGAIGVEGVLPIFRDKAQAQTFTEYLRDLTEGGQVVVGGRTMQMMLDLGWRPPKTVDMMVWNREVQSMWSADDMVMAMRQNGKPIFIIGGAYTFKSFMPHVENVFLTRAALDMSRGIPVYLPNLFNSVS